MARPGSIAPRWPSGPLPFVLLFGIASGLAIAHFPAARVGPLAWLYQVGTTIFRSQRGLQIVMDLAAAVHVIEAGVIAVQARKLGCSVLHTCGWMSICLLVGASGIFSLKAEARRRGRLAGKSK